MTYRHQYRAGGRAFAAGMLGAAAGAVILVAARNMMKDRHPLEPEDAPRRAWRRHASRNWREGAVVGRAITVNAPREEVYSRWRDFSTFPNFMENVISVTSLDQTRSRWVVEGPAGSTVEFETKIIEDRPGELIAWESDEDAEIRNSGRVTFRDAPGGRGTQIEAVISYDPPGGAVGRMAAKLFRKEPGIQAKRELRRFKQLMETGEIATAAAGPAAPRA
ncbi:SRPBCC family protein [Chelativorans sp. AA-79]|uniref:SRPBCC family protein n=1 Tax=Chelativorans sp. AA-79 TaxID=3028735 RepID=UPI0023F9D7A7|nr:SRPBCC family protein [Chelativorans sp. AA-79]WEX09538.1 SRPBCC family protein [Chelativorans sp. AA-79]